MRCVLLPLIFYASVGSAEDCPPVLDRADRLAEIYAELGTAQTPAIAQALSGELWGIWLDAPNDKAQALLDEGMARRQGFDLLGARDTLDELVEYCPDYAEGYNQRAFASFLRRDYAAALSDLDVVLSINPRHLGAMTGKGLTLLGLERNEEAQRILREAVKLNPWLSERALIEGTDI